MHCFFIPQCDIDPAMSEFFLDILTLFHFFCVAGLSLYGAYRIRLLICWLSHRRRDVETPAMAAYPRVTVQVPLYNEPRVAERVIDAVARLDWPGKKLDIQILNDSTDATCEIVSNRVAYWAGRGAPIKEIRRSDRSGYKAGALRNGMALCNGEFIALFDADFVPTPDFLKKTLPWFDREDVGMVQARWGFINAGATWLTKLQAMLLSPHFAIEHQTRYDRGLFFNFNGTAGVWRKSAIETAGGWQSDTVTEDLDLSYRAQMMGWRFRYLDHVSVPSELPVSLSHFRVQQERWTKGSLQTAGKILPALLRSSAPLGVKLEGMAHLLANLCWVFGLVVTLTLYPVIIHRIHIGIYQILWIDLPLFLLSSGAILSYYLIYHLISGTRRSTWSMAILPLLSIGLAPCFSLSVFQGLTRKGGEFVRTPKFGHLHSWRKGDAHLSSNETSLARMMLNVPLLFYSLLPLPLTWSQGTWAALPFISLFPMGFLLVISLDCYALLYSCKS